MPAPTKPSSDSGVSRMRSGAELVEQALADRVAAAVAADVLAHQEHARVALQRLAQRLAQRFAVGDGGSSRGLWLAPDCGVHVAAAGLRPAPSVPASAKATARCDLGLRPGVRCAWNSSSVSMPCAFRRAVKVWIGPRCLPVLDLRLVAVQLGVEHRVRAEAVGAELEEDGPRRRAPAASARLRGLVHRDHVHAVDARASARRRPPPWRTGRSATPSAPAPCPSRTGCSRSRTAPAAATARRGSCDSWNAPSATAPSPKKQAVTRPALLQLVGQRQPDRQRQAAADDGVAAEEARGARRTGASSRRARASSLPACRTSRP